MQHSGSTVQLAINSVDSIELEAKQTEIDTLKRELSFAKDDLVNLQRTKDAEIAKKDEEINRILNEMKVEKAQNREQPEIFLTKS